MEPLLSIICFAYDQERFIRDALDGFLMQEVDFPMEIIVHDDASSDDTQAIISAYAEKHPDVFKPILQQVNQHSQERGRVTRLCLEAAKGKYVALCEGDDFWTDPRKLQKQVSFLEANPEFSGCFHNVLQLYDKYPISEAKPWRSYDMDVFTLEDTFSRTALFHTCSLVCKREAMAYPTGAKKIRSGDMALFTLVATHGPLKLIEGNMAVYRKHAGGVTSDEQLKDYHRHRIELWKRLDDHFDGKYTGRINELIAFHEEELRKYAPPSLIDRIRNRLGV